MLLYKEINNNKTIILSPRSAALLRLGQTDASKGHRKAMLRDSAYPETTKRQRNHAPQLCCDWVRWRNV